ncbi:flagellar protein FlaG [Massilia sp. CFBP9012]|uniref:flagellar protein FlaG n=1 Tax=Massilia sp. CFBP9012 TaxID=3096531 RepID=UPI002A6A69F9|nr:flagellar protein FlaG [Massilia sp. CFBP9012]MDY0977575.1 flagellar protein FlaG [Massilia sp. CFBP9012]
MQIQSIGTPSIAKPEERPAAAAATAAGTVNARQVRPDTPDAPDALPGKDEVSAAVKKLNEAMPPSAQSLEFEIDEDSKEIVVKIIDQSTREVVRQMPSKEALEMAKAIDKMQGLLIRQTA